MSAKHAVITCDAGDGSPHSYKVTITDHSRYGVMVNKKEIPAGKPHELKHGDLVTLSFGMEYRFEVFANGCKPITPPPAEPKSAKKTSGKKRAAGEKSAVTSIVHPSSTATAPRPASIVHPSSTSAAPRPASIVHPSSTSAAPRPASIVHPSSTSAAPRPASLALPAKRLAPRPASLALPAKRLARLPSATAAPGTAIRPDMSIPLPREFTTDLENLGAKLGLGKDQRFNMTNFMCDFLKIVCSRYGPALLDALKNAHLPAYENDNLVDFMAVMPEAQDDPHEQDGPNVYLMSARGWDSEAFLRLAEHAAIVDSNSGYRSPAIADSIHRFRNAAARVARGATDVSINYSGVTTGQNSIGRRLVQHEAGPGRGSAPVFDLVANFAKRTTEIGVRTETRTLLSATDIRRLCKVHAVSVEQCLALAEPIAIFCFRTRIAECGGGGNVNDMLHPFSGVKPHDLSRLSLIVQRDAVVAGQRNYNSESAAMVVKGFTAKQPEIVEAAKAAAAGPRLKHTMDIGEWATNPDLKSAPGAAKMITAVLPHIVEEARALERSNPNRFTYDKLHWASNADKTNAIASVKGTMGGMAHKNVPPEVQQALDDADILEKCDQCPFVRRIERLENGGADVFSLCQKHGVGKLVAKVRFDEKCGKLVARTVTEMLNAGKVSILRVGTEDQVEDFKHAVGEAARVGVHDLPPMVQQLRDLGCAVPGCKNVPHLIPPSFGNGRSSCYIVHCFCKRTVNPGKRGQAYAHPEVQKRWKPEGGASRRWPVYKVKFRPDANEFEVVETHGQWCDVDGTVSDFKGRAAPDGANT